MNYKYSDNNHVTSKIGSLYLDDLDLQILGLLSTGTENKLISNKLGIPLSTTQRRTRKLFEKDLISSKFELNYKKLGLRKGLIHIYLSNGSIDKIGQEIANKKGITNVSVHIGNSDLVCTYICQSSKDLICMLSDTRAIEGVDRVGWSEEVYNISGDSTSDNTIYLN